MKIFTYNQYQFLKENIPQTILKESSEFVDMQMNMQPNPLGPGFGFATDPQMSIYSDDSSPYVDNYARVGQMANDLSRVMKNLMGDISTNIKIHKIDYFLDDIEEFKNLKILRIFRNNNQLLDVFISYELYDDEFFGVFKDFNGINKPKLKTDLFTDQRYNYINTEYYLKLTNYIYKIIYNWFIPKKGQYVVLQDYNIKDVMGNTIKIKKGSIFDVIGFNENNDKLYVIIKYKNDTYTINGDDYYYFNYWNKII